MILLGPKKGTEIYDEINRTKFFGVFRLQTFPMKKLIAPCSMRENSLKFSEAASG